MRVHWFIKLGPRTCTCTPTSYPRWHAHIPLELFNCLYSNRLTPSLGTALTATKEAIQKTVVSTALGTGTLAPGAYVPWFFFWVVVVVVVAAAFSWNPFLLPNHAVPLQVAIRGLRNHVELNGCIAKVAECHEESQRYEACLRKMDETGWLLGILRMVYDIIPI